MLLVTRKVNTRVYLEPSLRVNHGPFDVGFPFSGTVNTMSSLSGDLIVKVNIFTTGSGVSAFTICYSIKTLHMSTFFKKHHSMWASEFEQTNYTIVYISLNSDIFFVFFFNVNDTL